MKGKLIAFNQKKILYFIKHYLKKNIKKINTANSAICYFHNYGNLPSSSYLKLKFYGIIYLYEYLFNFIKNIISITRTDIYKIEKISKLKKNFNFLCISHVTKNDFLKNGSYKDKYLNINSENYKEILFFLISIDGYIPKNTQENLVLLKVENKKTSLLKFIKYFINFIVREKFSLTAIFHECNFLSEFSKKICLEIIKIIKKNDIKKIFCLYEAQPYQNNLFKELREKKYKIFTTGYYHTGLLPFHTSLFHRAGAPDKILISGEYQKRYLIKYLNWPKNKVQSILSFRYTNKSFSNLVGSILLPYQISRSKLIISGLKKILENSNNHSIYPLKIRNHPDMTKSNSHIKLIKEIKLILKKYKKKFNIKAEKKTICIGSTTSISLLLDQGQEVTHISEDPIFDTFNNEMWDILKVSEISNNIFIYKLIDGKNIMNISNKINKIQNYLK